VFQDSTNDWASTINEVSSVPPRRAKPAKFLLYMMLSVTEPQLGSADVQDVDPRVGHYTIFPLPLDKPLIP
jgi:hypothetical protein